MRLSTCRICGKNNDFEEDDRNPTCDCGEPVFVSGAMMMKRERESESSFVGLLSNSIPADSPALLEYYCDGCGEQETTDGTPLVFELNGEKKIFCNVKCKDDHDKAFSAKAQAALVPNIEEED